MSELNDAGRDQAEDDADTFDLRYPVELMRKDGSVAETISQLPLHPLRGADARRVMNARDKGAGDFMAALVCAVCRIPPSTFDRLDGRDIAALAEKCADFLGGAQPT